MNEAKAQAQAEKQRIQAERLALKAAAAEERARVKAAAFEQKQRERAAAAEARVARFRNGADWRHGDVSMRAYPSYQAYLDHQAAKLQTVRPGLDARFDEIVERFVKRFELLHLPSASSVLCLGARLGQEVKAFRSLGQFAVGIDLNPGSDNPFVMAGDFHELQFADRSIDCVYINSVDHILDLERFAAEVRRVLHPSGIFVAELVLGYEEGFWAGEYETLHWPKARAFAEHLAGIGGFTLAERRGLEEVGSPQWLQCVYKL